MVLILSLKKLNKTRKFRSSSVANEAEGQTAVPLRLYREDTPDIAYLFFGKQRALGFSTQSEGFGLFRFQRTGQLSIVSFERVSVSTGDYERIT